ncbi:hypothetical protein DAI22_03g414300 [Oryza sativa Japonica Group]|nr:hypothetical protein DAI22_03g414300 [Oryza sativa Japonica Group]
MDKKPAPSQPKTTIARLLRSAPIAAPPSSASKLATPPSARARNIALLPLALTHHSSRTPFLHRRHRSPLALPPPCSSNRRLEQQPYPAVTALDASIHRRRPNLRICRPLAPVVQAPAPPPASIATQAAGAPSPLPRHSSTAQPPLQVVVVARTRPDRRYLTSLALPPFTPFSPLLRLDRRDHRHKVT